MGRFAAVSSPSSPADLRLLSGAQPPMSRRLDVNASVQREPSSYASSRLHAPCHQAGSPREQVATLERVSN